MRGLKNINNRSFILRLFPSLFVSDSKELKSESTRESLLDEPELLPKLCCMLPGFLLFAVMLMLLVAGCVSPSTFYAIAAIFTMINMTWVANLAIFSVVGAWRMPCASSINWHSFLGVGPRRTLCRASELPGG